MISKKTSQAEKEKKLEELNGKIKAKHNETLRLQAQIAIVEAGNQELREKIKALEKQREEFNSRPDVIAARKQLQHSNDRIESLQGEIDRFRKLESLLRAQASRCGIDPDSPASSTMPDRRAEIVELLERETDPLTRGQLANQLREYDAQHQSSR